MQNIQYLQNRGFTITPAKYVVDCTQVQSKSPFFYYNPRYADKPDELMGVILAAQLDAKFGDYRVLIAGLHVDKKELPLAIISEAEYVELKEHYRTMAAARTAYSDSYNALVGVLRQLDIP